MWKWYITYKVGLKQYRVDSLETYDLSVYALDHLKYLLENGVLNLKKGARDIKRYTYEVK